MTEKLKFRVKAKSTDIDVVGQQGSIVLRMSLEILDEGPKQGTTIYADMFLTQAAAPYTYENLKALGFTGAPEQMVELEGLRDATMALRKEAIATCHEETYPRNDGSTGRKYVVDFINALGGGPVIAKNAMTERERAILKAQLKGIAAPVKKPATPNTRSEFDDD